MRETNGQIRKFWRNSPLEQDAFHMRNLRQAILSLLDEQMGSTNFQLCDRAVEIGGNLNPLSYAAYSQLKQEPEASILVDHIYARQKPVNVFPNTRFLSRGIPQDSSVIKPFMEQAPTTLFLESVMNYVGSRAVNALIQRASQVLIANNALTFMVAPTHDQAALFPDQILRDLEDKGFNSIALHKGLFHLVGIFSK
jgi:hypothetical protein